MLQFPCNFKRSLGLVILTFFTLSLQSHEIHANHAPLITALNDIEHPINNLILHFSNASQETYT